MATKKPGRPRKKPVKGKGKLSGRFYAGPPAHVEAVKNAKRYQARLAFAEKAWSLKIAGATDQQIADQLGCSKYKVHSTLYWLMDDMKARTISRVEDRRALVDAQLDLVFRSNVTTMVNARKVSDRKAASEVILGVLQQKRRLHALDVADSAYDPAQVVAMMRGIRQLAMDLLSTDPFRLRQFRDGLNRLRAGSAIDVPAVPEPEKDDHGTA